MKISLEETFSLMLLTTELPPPEREYSFHPKRRWRFDFAFPAYWVAVEVEGGIYLKTEEGYSKGHAHPKRFKDDCEKYNEAACLGWRVLRVTGEQVENGQALEWLERVMTVKDR